MPWVTFFGGRADLLDFLDFAYAEGGCQAFEAYSGFDRELRRFPAAASVAALQSLGTSPGGPHLALWAPAVSPSPAVRRITLKPGAVPGHSFRFTAEGAGLITLQCGGVADGPRVVASQLGWWTEASARAKAAPALRAADVDWAQLAALGRKLRAYLRRHASGVAADRPVLPAAFALAEAGYPLHDPTAPTVRLTVVAA